MWDIRIQGGSLIKPLEQESKERYIQCVADMGVEIVDIAITAEKDMDIKIGGEKVNSGETFSCQLREEGYGYTMVEVELCSQNKNFEKKFILAVLKPAPNKKMLYGLDNRPQFHYTPPYGYMNDPNGMMYNAYTGEYHFFYQAFPYRQVAGPKHWGHATTTDLVVFQEHNTALYPDDSGDMWSGTGIIDYDNIAGLYDETTPPEARMILVYYSWSEQKTSAGLAYTTDGGKTWIKAYGGRKLNFIGQQPGHIDPKVFWLEDEKVWIMICACGHLYTSTNLWDWIYNSSDMGYECPDIYQIKVEGTEENKYVRTYAGTFCRVGKIEKDADGILRFVAESEELVYNGDSLDRRNGATEKYGWYSGKLGVLYATQHYMAAPNDRIIAVSWLVERGLDTTETWAGAMTVAMEQKLYKRAGEYLLYSYPVEEMKSLRGELLYSCNHVVVSPESSNILDQVIATYADIDGVFIVEEGVTEFGFKLRTGFDDGDITIKYDVVNELLIADYSNSKHDIYNGIRTMKMELPEDRTVSIRILLDSIIVESFGNGGEAAISSIFCRHLCCKNMEFFTKGSNVTIKMLDVYKIGEF